MSNYIQVIPGATAHPQEYSLQQGLSSAFNSIANGLKANWDYKWQQQRNTNLMSQALYAIKTGDLSSLSKDAVPVYTTLSNALLNQKKGQLAAQKEAYQEREKLLGQLQKQQLADQKKTNKRLNGIQQNLSNERINRALSGDASVLPLLTPEERKTYYGIVKQRLGIKKAKSDIALNSKKMSGTPKTSKVNYFEKYKESLNILKPFLKNYKDKGGINFLMNNPVPSTEDKFIDVESYIRTKLKGKDKTIALNALRAARYYADKWLSNTGIPQQTTQPTATPVTGNYILKGIGIINGAK